ncbi:DUF6625 family protein [Stutzerimonas azotifigens]
MSMPAPRLVFLIPYFGQWPFWMPFFLKSVEGNPDIQWIFFSDCGVPDGLPTNVALRPMSFERYCDLVSQRLGIEFRPSNPYKLCDIKPALGYIHADELDGYDFWGFSDIDLVYGNLRAYFSPQRLARFDLLSTHDRRVSGHLCLLRNTPKMREAFKQVPGWRQKFSVDEHNAFDEGAFSRLFIRHKNWPEPMRLLADRFNPWRRNSEFAEAFTTPNARIVWHDGKACFPSRWIWRDGELTNDLDGARPFPYFHFITWKSKVWPNLAPESLVPQADLAHASAWSVTSEGFRSVNG